MPRLIWTPQALRDVQRLHRFLTGKNADAARRAVKAIRESVKMLARQPGIGRPADDMEPEYREWIIDFGNSGYVALYRYDGEAAAILAVRHQKRLATNGCAMSPVSGIPIIRLDREDDGVNSALRGSLRI